MCAFVLLCVIRAEFGRKNLPQAEMLYSKGIEIMPQDATLHRCGCWEEGGGGGDARETFYIPCD